MKPLAPISLVIVALSFAIAAADHGRDHKHKPPQQAVQACAKAKQGDACTVTIHGHTLAGTCVKWKAAALACRPTPPAESVNACESAEPGDACSFKHEGHDVSGTCASHHDSNEPLHCRPDVAHH